MTELDLDLRKRILDATGARSLLKAERVQSLWSGYGSIQRLTLAGGQYRTVILKHVRAPQRAAHPRGWATQRGDLRKRRSYAVEAAWYRHHARGLPTDCRVALPLLIECEGEDSWTLLLEDLGAAYPSLPRCITLSQARMCLNWLAALHAHGLHTAATELWPVGCYWHLDTRPDELAAMPEGEIKEAAVALDRALIDSPFQTLVHGDAKVANFCFADTAVAAVDFQYAGTGPGVRDVAYFLGSAFDETDLGLNADALVDHYFLQLRSRLGEHDDVDALEADWRALLPIAWTDFTRFLLGWAPEHGKLNTYTRQMSEQALRMISSS